MTKIQLYHPALSSRYAPALSNRRLHYTAAAPSGECKWSIDVSDRQTDIRTTSSL